MTPPSSRTSSPSRSSLSENVEQEVQTTRPQTRRRFSLTKDDVNPRTLFRRISSRGAPPTAYRETGGDEPRATSFDGARSNQSESNSSTGRLHKRTASETRESASNRENITDNPSNSRQPTDLRPGVHRRPTNLSERAAKKGNMPAVDAEGNEIDINDQVNLDGGLDVVLHCEVDQRDPSGATEPYRLLVPALWYDGSSDREKLDAVQAGGVQRKPTLLNRMGIGGRGHKAAQNQGAGNWGQDMSEESYSSGEDEVVTEPINKPPKKRLGLLRSLSRRRTNDDQYDEVAMPDQGQYGSSDPTPAAPITNKAAALGHRSVYDQVTSPDVSTSNTAQPRVNYQGESGIYNMPSDMIYPDGQSARASFNRPPSLNRPPSQGRDATVSAPQRVSSFKGGNVLRKKRLKQGAPSGETMGAVDKNQWYSGDYNRPLEPTGQASITGSRPGSSYNQGVRVSDTNLYDPDPAYLSSDRPGQPRVTRILSNPTNVYTANPPSSYPRQEPMPGAPTDSAVLSNPRQRSLRGNGILGRFTSRRATSAEQVPTAAQQNKDLDDDVRPEPQRTTSQGYTGIEAYREKPKRGLSLKDRAKKIFERNDGRRHDDGSDGYSYSSEDSYSSEGLGEENDHTRDHARTSHDQNRVQNQVPDQRMSTDQYRRVDDDEGFYDDEADRAAERPGMKRGLSQKIRLNIMRIGSHGGKSGRSKDKGKGRQDEEESYY